MDDQALQERLEQLRQRAEASRSDGLLEPALEACKEALELLSLSADDDTEHLATEFRLIAGDVEWDRGDLPAALQNYQEAAVEDPDSLDALASVAIAMFHLCRFQAARVQLEILSAEAPDMAELWYYLALLAQRSGEKGLETYGFRKAAQLDPERFPIPASLPREEIERMVAEILDSLPRPLRRALANTPVLLEDLPSEELLFSEDPPLDPLLLGLFTGVPVTEQSSFDAPADISRIVLFQKNIERIARTPEALYHELWVTLKHEIGHFWGLSEEDLTARGLE